MFSHIQRLIVPSSQFLLGSQLISHCLIDTRATTRSFDVGCIETPHVGFVHGYSVLVRVFLWGSQYSFILYLGVIEFVLVMSTTHFDEVVLASGDFGRILFGFAVVPGSIGEVALFVEGTGFVVGELVIPHNKIMIRLYVREG